MAQKKFSYGMWLLISGFVSFALGNIKESLAGQTISPAASILILILNIAVDIAIVYFLVMWVVGLFKKKDTTSQSDTKK